MTTRILFLAAALACAAAGTAHAQAPDLLTHEQLAATGRPVLSDALRRLRPAWMRMNASTARFATVYVDSVEHGSVEVLARLDVRDVRWVQYSGPEVVDRRFRTGNRTPVIHVSTRLPLGAAHAAEPPRPGFVARPLVSLFAAATGDRGGVLPWMELRPGVGAGVEVPALPNATVAASLSFAPGRVAGGSEGGAGLWTGELGIKARLNSDRALATFVAAGVTGYSVRWGDSGVTGTGRPDTGIGLSLGAGVEARAGRVLLFARGDVGAPMFNGRNDGQLVSLRLGSSLALGADR